MWTSHWAYIGLPHIAALREEVCRDVARLSVRNLIETQDDNLVVCTLSCFTLPILLLVLLSFTSPFQKFLASLAIQRVLCWMPTPLAFIYVASLFWQWLRMHLCRISCKCMRFLGEKFCESSAGNHYTLGSETTVVAEFEIILFIWHFL